MYATSAFQKVYRKVCGTILWGTTAGRTGNVLGWEVERACHDVLVLPILAISKSKPELFASLVRVVHQEQQAALKA